jgi:hypothetical protein
MHVSIATVSAMIGAAAADPTHTPSIELPTPGPPTATVKLSSCATTTTNQLYTDNFDTDTCTAAAQCVKDACKDTTTGDDTDIKCLASTTPTLTCGTLQTRLAAFLACVHTASATANCSALPLATDTTVAAGTYMTSDLYKSCEFLSCRLLEISPVASDCDLKGEACKDPSTTSDNETNGSGNNSNTDTTTDTTTDDPSGTTTTPPSGAASVATAVVAAFATMALLL